MKTNGLLAAAALAAFAAGCASHGTSGDDPVARLFEDRYPAFASAIGAHHAGCDLSLVARGDAGSKHDTLTSAVDVDNAGNYRLTRDDGSELVHVALHTWEKSKDGKVTELESGARPDLERDSAAAEWRAILEPLHDRVKLKRTGSGKIGTRPTTVYDLTLDAGGPSDGVKAEKGAGKIEVDDDTGFPVKVDLTATWSAPSPAQGGGRVTYSLEKMTCAVTDVGKVATIEPLGSVPGMPAPQPSATEAAATPKPEPTKKPAKPEHGKKK